MKKQYTKIHNLSVSNKLLNFINEELLKDTNISSQKFWEGFDRSVHELAPKNKYQYESNYCIYLIFDLV